MPIDTTEIQARLDAQSSFIASSLEVLDNYTLTTPAEKLQAEELLKLIKGRINDIEDARKKAVKPYSDEVNSVNRSVKPTRDKLQALERKLKNLLVDFERRRRAEEQRRLQAAAEAAQEGDTATAEALMSTRSAPVAAQGIQMRDVWAFEVVDEAAVPEAFWVRVLAEDKIKALIQAGERNIPGLRIFQDVQVAVRPR